MITPIIEKVLINAVILLLGIEINRFQRMMFKSDDDLLAVKAMQDTQDVLRAELKK